jgi:UDP-glucose 6-dehydrogenase
MSNEIKDSDLSIGICGFGFVGNAIYHFFKNKFIKSNNILFNKNYTMNVYDKYKNINEFNILLNTCIIYICLPTNYNEAIRTYDMTEIDHTISLLNDNNYKGIILIKSTIQPVYCNTINSLYPNLIIIHNPEFLSAKSAVNDFANQYHIILGFTPQSVNYCTYIYEFYKILFPHAVISTTNSIVSSLVKLSCNSFYATKIEFFTEIYLLCNKLNINYDTVRDLMLKNRWINPMHTTIPGHDNIISFGGACLPKDIMALNQFMINNNSMNGVVESVIKERNIIRCNVTSNNNTNKRRNSI